MRTIPTRALLLRTICLALSVFVGGKARPQQLCSVIRAPKTRTAAHMFSIQPERILGDIEAEWVENNYQAFHAEDRAAHLNAIVARVVSQFPHDLPLVQVILIEDPIRASAIHRRNGESLRLAFRTELWRVTATGYCQ